MCKDTLRWVLHGFCKNIFQTSIWQIMPHIKNNSPYPYGKQESVKT